MKKVIDFDDLNAYLYDQFAELAESRIFIPKLMNHFIESQIKRRYKIIYKSIRQLERAEERAERRQARQERRQALFARLRVFFGFKWLIAKHCASMNSEATPDDNVSSKIAEQTDTQLPKDEQSGDGAKLDDEATRSDDNVSS